MVGAFGQQAVDDGGVDAVRREDDVGDALRRILVEVEPGGAEGEVQVDDDRVEARASARCAQATLWAIVEAPTPPLAPTKAMVRPSGSAPGRVNSSESERTMSSVPTGATRYSLTPRASARDRAGRR